MPKRKYVNWHSATVDALKIDLRDYSSLLEYQTEYPLSNDAHRLDLLIIKKLTAAPIPDAICRHFCEFNIFEIKGIHSSLTTDAYYKTIGYAGLFINETGAHNQYTRQDLTLNFISRRFPRNIFQHLQRDCNKKIEKIAPGVYYINGETFSTQFLVTGELDPESYLYLKCLTDNLADQSLIQKLADDYRQHPDNNSYMNYMHQLTRANTQEGGKSPMVCEGILELCGTSSKEIIERTRKQDEEYYQPLLKEKDRLLSEKNDLLTEKDNLIAQLQAENERLRHSQT